MSTNTEIALKGKDGAMQTFDYGEYTNQGVSFCHEGAKIPFLSLIQPLSKAVEEGNEKFINGAKAGMMIVDGDLIDGKAGCLFIGIAEQHTVVEMTKLDGSGQMVAEHPPHGEVVLAASAQYGRDRSKWRSKAGNFLVERFNMFGVMFRNEEDMKALKGTPCILGFERTKLKAREHIMSPFRKCEDGKRPPLFALVLRIRTVLEKNKNDKAYYNYAIQFAVNDDFLSSLINPATQGEWWDKWAPEAQKIAKMVQAGKVTGDQASDRGRGGEPESESDIPF
jgi:hypothetical protein